MNLDEMLLALGGEVSKRYETLETAGVQGFAATLPPTVAESLSRCLGSLPPRDQLRIAVELEDGGAVSLRWPGEETAIQDFENALANLALIADDETGFQIRVDVTKQPNSTISVYSLDSFVEYVQQGALPGAFHVFKEANTLGIKYFETLDRVGSVQTTAYHWGSPLKGENENNIASTRLPDRAGIAHFANSGEYSFVPEYFHITSTEISAGFAGLVETLDTLSTATCLTYIANTSALSASGLTVRIEGYRSIAAELSFDMLGQLDHSSWFEIYDWIYSEGVIGDRLGLARNVLTLHVDNPNTLHLTENVLASIRSNHKLYLTANLEKYVEVNNSVVKVLFDIQQRSASAVDGFVQSFKGSALVFPTFFTSVVLLNAVKGNKISTIVTGEIFLIALGLILISSFHLVAANSDLHDKREAVSRLYGEMRDRYANLLDPEDLDRLLPAGGHPESVSVNRQVSRYVLVWIAILLVFFFLSVTLYLIGLGAST